MSKKDKYFYAIKAGRLANGAERGKGSVVHIVDLDSLSYGLAERTLYKVPNTLRD